MPTPSSMVIRGRQPVAAVKAVVTDLPRRFIRTYGRAPHCRSSRGLPSVAAMSHRSRARGSPAPAHIVHLAGLQGPSVRGGHRRLHDISSYRRSRPARPLSGRPAGPGSGAGSDIAPDAASFVHAEYAEEPSVTNGSSSRPPAPGQRRTRRLSRRRSRTPAGAPAFPVSARRPARRTRTRRGSRCR